MSPDTEQPIPRSNRRVVLEALGVGLAGQIATLLVLNRIASQQVAVAASSGVFFAALLSWPSAANGRRRWPGLLLRMVAFALIWVFIARALSLFD